MGERRDDRTVLVMPARSWAKGGKLHGPLSTKARTTVLYSVRLQCSSYSDLGPGPPGRRGTGVPTEGWDGGAFFPVPRREEGMLCGGSGVAGVLRGGPWGQSQMSDPTEMWQRGRTWIN